MVQIDAVIKKSKVEERSDIRGISSVYPICEKVLVGRRSRRGWDGNPYDESLYSLEDQIVPDNIARFDTSLITNRNICLHHPSSDYFDSLHSGLETFYVYFTPSSHLNTASFIVNYTATTASF